MIRIACIATLTLTLIQPSFAQDTSAVAALEWRSTSVNDQAVSAELTEFYLSLYNTGNLNIREAQVGKSGFVEELLREQGLLRGGLTAKMESLLCDLNPDVCSRPLIKAPDSLLSDMTAHVGGYASGPVRWTTPANATVKIPDYRFENVTVLSRTEVPASWRPEDYKAPADLSCAKWNESCESLVKRFNPPTIRRPKGTMQVTLPENRIMTTFALKQDAKSSYTETLKSVGVQTLSVEAKQDFAPLVSASPEWHRIITDQSPSDLTIRSLNRNLRPVGTVSKNGARQEKHFGKQSELLTLINHPYAGSNEAMDEEYRQPVSVLVIDSKLSEGHCDWSDAGLMDGTKLAAPVESAVLTAEAAQAGDLIEMPPPADCDKIDENALSDRDHATGIGGLIGAQSNGKGIVGLNPFAKLLFMEFDRHSSGPTQVEHLIDSVQGRQFSKDIRVANMSFRVEPGIGNFIDFKTALASRSSQVLFVVAAGNEGHAMSADNCGIMPACFNDLDNVITVVGLNTDLEKPGAWKTATEGSNTNARFEIGAIAENVFTTVSGNRFAHKSGTSFAAPQVAAAASLIFAAGEFIYARTAPDEQLNPKIVKDRLTYTADFFPAISGKVYAGRLNISRAMNLQYAQFELFDGRRIVGTVKNHPNWFKCITPDENEQDQPWWNIRRIVYNETSARHIIFKHINSDPGDRLTKLDRFEFCNLNTESPDMRVAVRNGETFEIVAFKFGEIKDFTSPLLEQ